MRESASRGFFLPSKAPFGYRRVKVNDGVKERPTLEVDPATAPVVREIFESSLRGNGLKEICKALNGRGITNGGKRSYKGGLHYLLTNQAYTGTAVWGRTSKGEKAQDPVRVEGAWPALVSRGLFDEVQQAMRDRAPKVQRPARVGSKFLLSGLLKYGVCGVCGRPYSGQGAKSGQFAYYICGTLFREGARTCSARYLNSPRVEDFVVEKIRERILTEETIVELVTMVAEEIDAMPGELAGRLEVIEAELSDVRKRLEKLYEALETSELTHWRYCRLVSCLLGTVRSSCRLGGRTPLVSLSSAGWSCPPPRRSGGTWRTSGSFCRRGRSLSARLSSVTS